jgi:hypothetical protein
VMKNVELSNHYQSSPELKAEIDLCFHALVNSLSSDNWKIRMNAAIALKSGCGVESYGSSFCIVLEGILTEISKLVESKDKTHLYYDSLLAHLVECASKLLDFGKGNDPIFQVVTGKCQTAVDYVRVRMS